MSDDLHLEKRIKVYVGIGSNLGDRWEMLCTGVQGLKRIAEGGMVEVSPIYETQPWGPIQQGPYLNGVVRFWTSLSPFVLHSLLMEIERKVGRVRGSIRYGPRELDLDILLFGDQIIKTLQLEIPHPRMMERRFVLVPLADLGSDEIIPGVGITVSQALMECPDQGWIREVGRL